MSQCYCSFSPEQEQQDLMLVQEVTLGSLSPMGAGVRHTQDNTHKRNNTVQQNILFFTSYFFLFKTRLPSGAALSSIRMVTNVSNSLRKLISLIEKNQDSLKMLLFDLIWEKMWCGFNKRKTTGVFSLCLSLSSFNTKRIFFYSSWLQLVTECLKDETKEKCN